jgi:succinate-acetate transporter protein
MFEFPNQNTFGLRRFVSHRIFWLALALLNMFARQFSIAQERLAEAQSWFFLCWIIFTAIVLTAAFDLNVSLIVTFVRSLATFCWRSAISKRNLKGQ